MKPYATGIYVFQIDGGWCAKLNWQSGEFSKPGFVEGHVETRYFSPSISDAVDLCLNAVRPLSLSFHFAKNTSDFVSYDDSIGREPTESQLAAVAEENARVMAM